jgi:hypothetical protein
VILAGHAALAGCRTGPASPPRRPRPPVSCPPASAVVLKLIFSVLVRHQSPDRACRATFPPAWSSRAPGTWRAASPRIATRASPAAPGSAVPGPAGSAGSFLVPGSLSGTPVPKKLPGAKMFPDLFRPAEPGLAWPGRRGWSCRPGGCFPAPDPVAAGASLVRTIPSQAHTPRPRKISQRGHRGGCKGTMTP